MTARSAACSRSCDRRARMALQQGRWLPRRRATGSQLLDLLNRRLSLITTLFPWFYAFAIAVRARTTTSRNEATAEQRALQTNTGSGRARMCIHGYVYNSQEQLRTAGEQRSAWQTNSGVSTQIAVHVVAEEPTHCVACSSSWCDSAASNPRRDSAVCVVRVGPLVATPWKTRQRNDHTGQPMWWCDGDRLPRYLETRTPFVPTWLAERRRKTCGHLMSRTPGLTSKARSVDPVTFPGNVSAWVPASESRRDGLFCGDGAAVVPSELPGAVPPSIPAARQEHRSQPRSTNE
jgi:hypothetical protein